MRRFLPDQEGTTVHGSRKTEQKSVCVLYAATEKPHQNALQGEKGHLWMGTN